VAVGEPAGDSVPAGDTELVGLAFRVGVDLVVGVDVVVGGDVIRSGAGDAGDCPVVAGLLTVAGCAGLTRT
jgi:hypothetical protein